MARLLKAPVLKRRNTATLEFTTRFSGNNAVVINPSKIKEIQLQQRDNGTFFVVIVAPSEAAAKAIADFCKAIHLRSDHISGKYLHFSCTDPELMAYFIGKIVAFDGNAHQQRLAEIYQQLKVLPDPQFMIPAWYREGNYFAECHSGTTLNKQVEFHSTQAHSRIQKLTLCGYKNNSVYVSLKMANEHVFDALANALQKEGFPEPDAVDRYLKTIAFRNHDMTLIAHFLAIIDKVEPSFAGIKRDVCTALSVNLDQVFPRHHWVVTGKFDETFDSGSTLNRSLQLDYTAPGNSPLKNIELLGYSDNTIAIKISLKKGHTIKDLIQNRNVTFPGLTLDASFFKESMYFKSNNSDPKQFLSVLRFIKKITGDRFQPVEKLLLESLQIQTRSLFAQAMTQLKKQTHAVPSSSASSVSTSKVPSSTRASFKDKLNRFLGNVVHAYDDVCEGVNRTLDDLSVTLDDITRELEAFAIETGEAVEDTFEAFEACLAPLINQFDCLSLRANHSAIENDPVNNQLTTPLRLSYRKHSR